MSHTPTSRRRVLLYATGLSGLLAARQWLPAAFAQTSTPKLGASPTVIDAATRDFLAFSSALTERNNLSPAIAQRMVQAAQAVSAPFAPALAKLTQLKAPNAQALLAAADAAGLKEHALAVRAAWYTGTVEGPKQSQVVAYQEALMYQPVIDGLPVPTYCLGGPLWWAQKPPGIA